MLVQNLFCFFKRRSNRNRDQVLIRHHLPDRNIGAGLEAQIAIGQNAYQLLPFVIGTPEIL